MEAEIRTQREAPSEILYDGHVHTSVAGHRERNADERERVYIKLVDRCLCRTRLNEPQSI
jgi:hypothetical protein